MFTSPGSRGGRRELHILDYLRAGLVPKLPNDSTKFLNGLGAFAIPAGASGLALLEQHTASSSSTLDFTSWYSSTYDEYLVELVNVLPATNGTDLRWLLSTDGGLNYQVTNYVYGWDYVGQNTAHNSSNSGASTVAFVLIGSVVSNTQAGVSGSLRLFDPGSSAQKSINLDINHFQSSSSQHFRLTGFGKWASTTAYNAIRFLFSSGAIASGTIRVYGISK